MLTGDHLQSKENKSRKDHCIEELVNTEEKFVAALQMIREVNQCEYYYRNRNSSSFCPIKRIYIIPVSELLKI